MGTEGIYGDARWAEFYDANIVYQARRDVSFFVEESCRAGGETLEIGCGTGRVLIPTVRAGARVTGLDRAEGMLARCRANLDREPPEVRARASLVHGDMREFDLGRRFALVTFPFRPFQHLLTVEEQLACLACVRRHLDPGGKMVLDLFDPWLEKLLDKPGTADVVAEFALSDGSRVVRRAAVLERNLHAQVSLCSLTHEVTRPDGRRESFTESFEMRHLFRFEAEHLLVRAGFQVEALYAGYDRAPYGSRYPGELIFVARREG